MKCRQEVPIHQYRNDANNREEVPNESTRVWTERKILCRPIAVTGTT